MIYSGSTTAKTGQIIPLYKSGRPAHSKYNPAADMVPVEDNFTGCLIVFGIGAAFHIKNLLQNNNLYKISCAEADKESLDFCRKLSSVKEIEKDERIALCSFENFAQCLKENYLPSFHKKLKTVFLRSWYNEIPDADNVANEILSNALESISADISVQVHFGKHWHANILSNLKFISDNRFLNNDISVPEGKTKAAVIAAGPTLDNSIGKLKEQRESVFIISTDTAYGTLLPYNIIPDAVISVDAQQVSSEHFLGTEKSDTVFIFDISSNPETVQMVFNKGSRLFFIRSHHPLSALIKEEINIPFVESGAGTVTIAAADFARQLGFTQIEFFGADFAYSDGKPYCRGTYLEKKFSSISKRTVPSENLYTALMFRTELKKISAGILGKAGKSPVTSKVLAAYGKSLISWAENNSFVQDGNVFTCKNAYTKVKVNPECFDFKSFINNYTDKVKALSDKIDSFTPARLGKEIEKSLELISLLPLMASFRKDTIIEDNCLALQLLLYYNL